jgi:CHASE3 domain sensor protein
MRLLAGDASQQQQLTRLKSLIAQRVDLSKQSLELQQLGKSTFALQANQINQTRGEIRQTLAQLQAREEQLLEISVRHSQQNIHN